MTDVGPLPNWLTTDPPRLGYIEVRTSHELAWAHAFLGPGSVLVIAPGTYVMLSPEDGVWEDAFLWRRRHQRRQKVFFLPFLALVAGQFCPLCGIHHVERGAALVTEREVEEVSLIAPGELGIGGRVRDWKREFVCPRCGVLETRRTGWGMRG